MYGSVLHRCKVSPYVTTHKLLALYQDSHLFLVTWNFMDVTNGDLIFKNVFQPWYGDRWKVVEQGKTYTQTFKETK